MNSDLETRAGYVFRDPDLLDMALTHASVQQEGADYERLEFLGDRVLGLVVAHMLYTLCPRENEGQLARRHAGLVQQAALAEVALALDLGHSLKLSAGEKKAGGDKKDAILADALEAMIGAIFLDGGFSAAETFVTKFWRDMLLKERHPPEDPKTKLQEWAQARGLGLPEYKIIAKSGAEHAPMFEVEVQVKTKAAQTATAPNKRDAEKEAARKMLEMIGEAQ